MPTYSCYVIGDDSLVILCCEIILKHNGKINGVLSTDAQIKKWTLDNNIPVYHSLYEFEQLLKSSSYDYLFSISI
jgi:hypothetical protein